MAYKSIMKVQATSGIHVESRFAKKRHSNEDEALPRENDDLL